MTTKRIQHGFSLLEVVVAMAILAMGLAGLLSLLFQAQMRIVKNYDKWLQMHMLSQGAEYYMLNQENCAPPPPTIFSYPDYRLNANHSDAEGLPSSFSGLTGQLPLRKLTLELIRESDGTIVDQLILERIGYESAQSSR